MPSPSNGDPPLPTSDSAPSGAVGRTEARFATWLRRSLTRLLVGLVLVVIAGVLVRARFFAPVTVRTTLVERGEVRSEIFGRGTVESAREASLGFDLVGRLSEVLVDEGERVTIGQELARLAPEQVSADLRVAATGIGVARASLERLAAEERGARATLAASEREEQRLQALVASGTAPQRDLDRAADTLRLARAGLDRVLAQRGEATRSVELASGGVEQRRVTLRRASLLAPFDGLVIRRLKEPGDVIAVGSTVLRVVDTEQTYVSAWIDETLLGRIRVGQPARIRVPGAEREVAGRVSRVGWEADRQTHELLVDVTPSESLGRVAIGQRADVWIADEKSPDALRLPVDFLQRDGQGPFCAVDAGGRIVLRRLELGVIGREVVEVRAGLTVGETALVSPLPGAALVAGRRWSPP